MTLAERIADFRNNNKRATFTLEAGHGETYSHSRPVLYGHGTYKRGSVLAGRSLRAWLNTWDSWEAARAELKTLKLKFDDAGPEGGSTHIPIDVLTAGIPDDTDY
jgi:hypothetical protein